MFICEQMAASHCSIVVWDRLRIVRMKIVSKTFYYRLRVLTDSGLQLALFLQLSCVLLLQDLKS